MLHTAWCTTCDLLQFFVHCFFPFSCFQCASSLKLPKQSGQTSPKVTSVAELQALSRNYLILTASAHNLVVTSKIKKNLLAQRMQKHKHNKITVLVPTLVLATIHLWFHNVSSRRRTQFLAAQLSRLQELVNEAVPSQCSSNLSVG